MHNQSMSLRRVNRPCQSIVVTGGKRLRNLDTVERHRVKVVGIAARLRYKFLRNGQAMLIEELQSKPTVPVRSPLSFASIAGNCCSSSVSSASSKRRTLDIRLVSGVLASGTASLPTQMRSI